MAETSSSSIDALREVTAAASNSLGLFSDDIVENFLSDIDEEALAEVSESHESSEQLAMTVSSKQTKLTCTFSSWWTKMLIKTQHELLKRG